MYDFDIYYFENDGSQNHRIICADSLSQAVQYVADSEKCCVYRAECRDTGAMIANITTQRKHNRAVRRMSLQHNTK